MFSRLLNFASEKDAVANSYFIANFGGEFINSYHLGSLGGNEGFLIL